MEQSSALALWLWGVGQATCIGLVAWCLLSLGSRLAPSARARVALWTLWLMSCVPVLMWLPIGGLQLPWTEPATTQRSASTNQSASTEQALNTNPPAGTAPSALPSALPSGLADSQGRQDTQGQATLPWDQALATLNWALTTADGAHSSREPQHSGLTWAQWALYCIAGCMAYGCLRMVSGLWQIRAIRRGAASCSDARLLRIGHESLTAMQLPIQVQWLQHPSIGSPAVIGVRRPAIILPSECQSWSDEQLRCAITHELAHIKRHDVFTTLMAQVGLVLNYFHPLGHVLVRRMRLDQELAADCLAAQLVGGQRLYLETLATLALQRDQAVRSSPALAFLPAPRTFVRRLEMLRNIRLASSHATRWQAIALPMGMVCLAIIAMIVRPSTAQPPEKANSRASATAVPSTQAAAAPAAQQPGGAAAAAQPAAAQPAGGLPDLLSYFPEAAAVGVVIADVDQLLQSEQLMPLLSQLPAEQRAINLPSLTLKIEDVEQVMLILSDLEGPNSATIAVRFKSGATIPQPAKSADIQGKSYGFAPAMAALDARTILLGTDAVEMKPLLLLASATGDQGDLKKLIERHSDSPIRGALRVSSLRPAIESAAGSLGFLGPLWRDVTTASAGIKVAERLELSAMLDSPQPTSIRETLEALKTLARNALNAPASPSPQPSGGAAREAMMLQMAKGIAQSVLRSVTITEQPTAVEVKAQFEQSTATLISLLLPAVTNARAAAQRSQNMNSMKQIALALHNYHDAYGHFPPSVITENGVQRSWRVEILPYLEQVALYNRYRKDEPWDSPNNKQLSQIQIPQYAPLTVSTAAPYDPSLTPVRGLGGERGMLGTIGRKMVDITDGTSNTLMVVQSTEMVPWTKPDLYAPSPEELLRAAGPSGGFLAAFADGSVKYLSSSVDPTLLKALMTINGGEPVNLP